MSSSIQAYCFNWMHLIPEQKVNQQQVDFDFEQMCGSGEPGAMQGYLDLRAMAAAERRWDHVTKGGRV